MKITNYILHSRYPVNFANCVDPDDLSKIREYDENKFTMEYAGFFNWSSTLADFLNDQTQMEKILIADQFQISEYNEQHPNDTLNILDEVIFGYYDSLLPVTIDQSPDLVIYEAVLILLRENGLIDRTLNKYFDLKNLKPEPEPEDPKVLTLSHLGFGFKIHCFFLLLALITFVAEVWLPIINNCKTALMNRKSKTRKFSMKSKVSIQLEVLAEI